MNPFAERAVTAKPRPEPERRPQERETPDRRTTPAPAVRTKPQPQPEPMLQAKPASRAAERTRSERSQGNSQSSGAKRADEPQTATPDAMLFSTLLDMVPTPPALHPGVAELQPRAHHAPAAHSPMSGGAPLALWQPLEAELGRIADRQPDGPVAMTLLLPRLGAVDARLQHLPAGGWDIALRFSPSALGALEAHQERCRQALRRRLASRVRLRFEQRGAA